MPRFFVGPHAIDGEKVTVSGDDAFHIARSLRMAAGEEITVCCEGDTMLCRLDTIRDTAVTATVLRRGLPSGEVGVPIHLYMGYPKGDKLELVVQKAAELGAATVTPFISERCIKRPAAEKEAKNLTRLQRIADEACGQSGRSVLMQVRPTLSYAEALEEGRGAALRLFCYEREDGLQLGAALSDGTEADSVSVFIGSEGGFSQNEADLAAERGYISVGLGSRILRCETAAMYALVRVAAFFEGV